MGLWSHKAGHYNERISKNRWSNRKRPRYNICLKPGNKKNITICFSGMSSRAVNVKIPIALIKVLGR